MSKLPPPDCATCIDNKSQSIAVLGASSGQLPTVLKAKSMGYRVIVFGWDEGAVCKEYADKFYPISITDYDEVAKICAQEKVVAVTSNMADTTALASAVVAEKLGLPGIPGDVIRRVMDKSGVRDLTKNVVGLSQPQYLTIELNKQNTFVGNIKDVIFPCIVKPCTASGKIGVSLCSDATEFAKALDYAAQKSTHILVEQFIGGVEVSVETISHAGKHYVVQITDKENTGAPHFVEIAQHQPSQLNDSVKQKIKEVVKVILDAVGYDEAAAHIEMKIDGDNIYLIEINPRGGGDFISTVLTPQSTGYDYIAAMIDLSLGRFNAPIELNFVKYAGLYWLTGNVEDRIATFSKAFNYPWVIDFHTGENLHKHFSTNVGKDSYIIYAADHKITAEECDGSSPHPE